MAPESSAQATGRAEPPSQKTTTRRASDPSRVVVAASDANNAAGDNAAGDDVGGKTKLKDTLGMFGGLGRPRRMASEVGRSGQSGDTPRLESLKAPPGSSKFDL